MTDRSPAIASLEELIAEYERRREQGAAIGSLAPVARIYDQIIAELNALSAGPGGEGGASETDAWDPEPLMTAGQVAEALGVRRSRVYEIPVRRVRIGRRTLRWRPEDVRNYLERRSEA